MVVKKRNSQDILRKYSPALLKTNLPSLRIGMLRNIKCVVDSKRVKKSSKLNEANSLFLIGLKKLCPHTLPVSANHSYIHVMLSRRQIKAREARTLLPCGEGRKEPKNLSLFVFLFFCFFLPFVLLLSFLHSAWWNVMSGFVWHKPSI